jgi:hypothetical protein
VKWQSIADVCDVTVVRGAQAGADDVPHVLLEVPHGATRAVHYDALFAVLRGPFPEGLKDFFFVNTDVGAPEAALAIAHTLTQLSPARSIAILRCLIPRTFIDCNRDIDPSAVPTTSTATGMTPGIVRYVQDPADLALLLSRYGAYRQLASDAFAAVCGGGGVGVMLHSYAPRSVDVPVDERIVERLRAAYQPDVEPTWPLRVEVDFMTTTPDGVCLASAPLVATMRAVLADASVPSDENGNYPLHPSTLAHTFAARHPGQTVLIELRRDLLVQRFTPFAEMVGDDVKVARLAGLLARGLHEGMARG